MLAGLGLLVHPDFAIFTLAFVAAFFIVTGESHPIRRVQALVIALFIPALYEVFRMGYYGALVPNPAFAKEAGSSNWSQGWQYLLDTVNTYWLAIPLAIIVATALHLSRGVDGGSVAVIFAPVDAAIVHGLYVVYMGGDFMHARYFLPDIFAFALPVAVIPFDTAPRIAAALAVGLWALVCAITLHPAYNGIGPHGISNERAFYVANSHNAHPITPGDYRLYASAVAAVWWSASVPSGFLRLESGFMTKLRAGMTDERVIEADQIGIFSYLVPPDVYVEDYDGLADPLASHMQLVHRGRPGHEKLLPESWIVARFAAPGSELPPPLQADVTAARSVLSCDAPRQLLDAASAPMSVQRFVSNVFESFASYGQRVPSDPHEARSELC